jgi:hypothetical protein
VSSSNHSRTAQSIKFRSLRLNNYKFKRQQQQQRQQEELKDAPQKQVSVLALPENQLAFN